MPDIFRGLNWSNPVSYPPLLRHGCQKSLLVSVWFRARKSNATTAPTGASTTEGEKVRSPRAPTVTTAQGPVVFFADDGQDRDVDEVEVLVDAGGVAPVQPVGIATAPQDWWCSEH